MRVGVFIPQVSPQAGGAYTFQESIIEELEKLSRDHEFYIFHYGENNERMNSKVIYIRIDTPPQTGLLSGLIKRIKLKLLRKLKIKIFKNKKALLTSLASTADKFNIELMWFLTPAFEDVSIPYIYTVWDLQHRLQPFFPEVSVTGSTWDSRDQLFSKVLPRATYILTGTDEGKREIMKFYNIDSERIKVLPLPTPSYCFKSSNIYTSDFNNDKPFLFYPAQFWPHKNHIGLLFALKILKEKYSLYFNLVLTGSDKGNLGYIERIIHELDLANDVNIYGFVDFYEIIKLYRSAFALVFPSFFGPDNIPPLEAFVLDCPVIAADVPGARDQLEDAALLVDARNEEEIALAVKKLYENPELRKELILKGKKRALKWTSENYTMSILELIDQFSKYRRCWSNSEKYYHL